MPVLLLRTSLCLAICTACGAIKPLPAGSMPPQPPQLAAVPLPASQDGGPMGEPLPQLENTFGADARQLVTSTQFPWSAVGKLNTGCTATLIDLKLVLTAAHCILDPDGKWLANAYAFYPNMAGGRSQATAHASYVWYGTRTPLRPGTAFVDDWAILLLDRDLGTTFGYLGTKDYTPVPGDKVTLVGYSADVDAGNTATAHVDCQIRPGTLDGQLAHDCHMTRGASGGSLWSYAWGQPVIVAVQSVEARDGGETSLHLADYDGTHPNGAVPASRFFPSLQWVVDHY